MPDAVIVSLLHGANLNLLGQREPHIYGTATLDDYVATATRAAAPLGLTIAAFQTNHEGELVEAIHAARTRAAAIIIWLAGCSRLEITKSRICPAVFARVLETSNVVTAETPSRPARRDAAFSTAPSPSGLTTPSAVTATRRCGKFSDAGMRRRFFGERGGIRNRHFCLLRDGSRG